MYYLLTHSIGFLAMSLNIASYQLKESRQMILWRMISDITYILHYFMLGALSGCTTLIISIPNAFICSQKENFRWAGWRGWKWLFSVLLVFACLITWRSNFDPIPCICTLISVLVTMWLVWTGDPSALRLGKLICAGPTWIIYCIAVGSYPGILTEIIGITSAALGIYRYGLKGHKTEHKREDLGGSTCTEK